jgi:hypothetical protein
MQAAGVSAGATISEAIRYASSAGAKDASPSPPSSTTSKTITAMSPLSGLAHYNPYAATITKSFTAGTTKSKLG